MQGDTTYDAIRIRFDIDVARCLGRLAEQGNGGMHSITLNVVDKRQDNASMMANGLGKGKVIIWVGGIGFLKDQVYAHRACLLKAAQQLRMADTSPGPKTQVGNAVVVNGDDDNVRGAACGIAAAMVKS